MNFCSEVTVSQGLCLPMHAGNVLVCFRAGSACLGPPAWHFHLFLRSSSLMATSKAGGLCLGLPLGTVRGAEDRHSGPCCTGSGIFWGQQLSGHLDPVAPVWNTLPAQDVVAAEPSKMSRAAPGTVHHSLGWRKADADLEQLPQRPHLQVAALQTFHVHSTFLSLLLTSASPSSLPGPPSAHIMPGLLHMCQSFYIS